MCKKKLDQGTEIHMPFPESRQSCLEELNTHEHRNTQFGTHHQPDLTSTRAANRNATGRWLSEHTLTAIGSGGGESASMLGQGAGRTYRTCTNTNIVN